MTTQKQQDWMRVIVIIINGLMLPVSLWVLFTLVDVKQRVAVIESKIDRPAHVQRALIYEVVDLRVEAAFEKLEDRLDKVLARIEAHILDRDKENR